MCHPDGPVWQLWLDGQEGTRSCHIITLSTWRKGISSGGWEDRKQKTEIQEPLIPFFYPGIPRHVEDLRRGVSMGMPIVQIKAEM